ncbi:FAD-dependent oxidoreductase [Nocardioides sp. LML1-1-1.1]|uniref:FAD-dependent oxidoreductase n=1 Tax=Nocardioides sp. LML1-1-1.1 TaxID=3135248 RepID=UPI0034364CDA
MTALTRARRPFRVAVIGAGPAGIYTADTLLKAASEFPQPWTGVRVDIHDHLPTPFGLIRYGVAPDHPRVKGITQSLTSVLEQPEIRFFGNVRYPDDLDLPTLRAAYDAVIFATGAMRDRSTDLPGAGLDGSYGAADFVAWYDAHPDVPRDWALDAERVAVVGAGNVALDVARVLARNIDEMRSTEIPDHVEHALTLNRAREIHIFARRGPAQAKFTQLELRELGECSNVRVVVDRADLIYDEASRKAIQDSKIVSQVVNRIEDYAALAAQPISPNVRTVFLHFLAQPTEILGEAGRVVGLRTERQELDGSGRNLGTGQFIDWPVEAVYRAVGYQPDPVAGLPHDDNRGVVPNAAGRVLDDVGGQPLPGIYACGWVKRGPVGLIGHTRADAKETVASMLHDVAAGKDLLGQLLIEDVSTLLPHATTWSGWGKLDAYEQARGLEKGRERTKVADRDEMISISRL